MTFPEVTQVADDVRIWTQAAHLNWSLHSLCSIMNHIGHQDPLFAFLFSRMGDFTLTFPRPALPWSLWKSLLKCSNVGAGVVRLARPQHQWEARKTCCGFTGFLGDPPPRPPGACGPHCPVSLSSEERQIWEGSSHSRALCGPRETQSKPSKKFKTS